MQLTKRTSAPRGSTDHEVRFAAELWRYAAYEPHVTHMLISRSPDFRALVLQAQDLAQRALRERDGIVAAQPTWPLEKDARITCFAKFVNTVNSAQLALMFLDYHLLDPSWWEQSGTPCPAGVLPALPVFEFSQFTKFAFVQGIFGSIESTLRILLRALDSAACEGGAGEFQTIYRVLLGTKLQLPREEWEPALEFWRNIRNTIHNNGVHVHRRGADASVTFRGVAYDFTHGQPLEFVTWPLVMSSADELLRVLALAVSAPTIGQVPGPLLDPQAS